MPCSVDNADREALLLQLQTQADGPQHHCDIHERSLGQAAVAALVALVLVLMGGWLASLPAAWHLHAVQWLLWVPGALLLGAGLASLFCAEALRRRHGQRVLWLTPDTVHFANAVAATPWREFDGFELEQRYLSLSIVFSTHVGSSAPVLTPACFKSLAAPDARSVAGGLRVRLWLFNPMLDGRRLDLEGLKDLLFAYLEAAQARATLGKLFPTVQRFSNVSTS